MFALRQPALISVCFWGWSVGSVAASCRGIIAGGGSGWGWQHSPNTLCLAFAAESCPRSPAVPSSPPALILSEAPQPLSAEALAPALQQLDLAAPTTVQVRTMSVPRFPHPQGLEYNACFPPACQAPFAFPAELRPLQVCQGQADKLQWQGANGHMERDSSRGKHADLAVVIPQWGHQGSSPPCSLPTDICAFCHKAVGPQEPTVEAMRKQYHADCFTCRTCQRRLAGQRYYQRDGRPTCDACYQVGDVRDGGISGSDGILGNDGIRGAVPSWGALAVGEQWDLSCHVPACRPRWRNVPSARG